MDGSAQNRILKLPFDTKQILGFDIDFDKLVPGHGSPLQNERVEIKAKYINEEDNEELDNISEVIDKEIEDVDKKETEKEGAGSSSTTSAPPRNLTDDSNPTKSNALIKQKTSFSFKPLPNFNNCEPRETSTSKINFVNLFDILTPPDLDYNQDLNEKSQEHHLKKERVSLSDFYADLEFIRQPPPTPPEPPPTPPEQYQSRPPTVPLHTTNPFRKESSNDIKTSPNNEIEPDKAIKFFDCISKENIPIKPDINDSSDKPALPIRKTKVDPASNPVDLFDWAYQKPLILKQKVSENKVSKSYSQNDVNFKINKNNPFIVNQNDITTTLGNSVTISAISKSKMNKNEMATLWDYIPPSPSSFQDCHVDSGNVDALVSQVLQRSSQSRVPSPRKSEIDARFSNSEEFGSKRKSKFFNPGISINFNYNPVFSADTTWTWNHQQPPGSPSAYFPSNVSTKCSGVEHKKVFKAPPYLLQLDPNVSDISLIPMIHSLPVISPGVSSNENFSPEDRGSDSDIETSKSPKKYTKKFSKKHLMKKETNDIISPLSCRINEILNQFNKIDEDDIDLADITVDNINISVSQRTLNENIMVNDNQGKGTSQNTLSPTLKPILKNNSTKITQEQCPNTFKLNTNSRDFKRNIVQENILLAKHTSMKPSFRTVPNSSIVIPSLAQVQKLPASQLTNMRNINSQRIQQPSLQQLSRGTPNPAPVLNFDSHHLHHNCDDLHQHNQQSHARVQPQATVHVNRSMNHQNSVNLQERSNQLPVARTPSVHRSIFQGTVIDTRRHDTSKVRLSREQQIQVDRLLRTTPCTSQTHHLHAHNSQRPQRQFQTQGQASIHPSNRNVVGTQNNKTKVRDYSSRSSSNSEDDFLK